MDDGSNTLVMLSKTVVIFGTFDSIHPGHNDFIKQSKKQGNKLVAIVARDTVVKKLKNKIPIHNESTRLNMVSNLDDIDQVFLGDEEQGVYNVLRKINPEIVFLGYDQVDLYNDLKDKIKIGYLGSIDLIFGESYKPGLFHSSILNNKK